MANIKKVISSFKPSRGILPLLGSIFMNFNSTFYLIVANWRLFTKLKLRIGKNGSYAISRIYILLPLIIYLGCECFFGGSHTKLWVMFLISIMFLEMTRIYNRCVIDPLHLFYMDATFKSKCTYVILSEFFGVKFLSLFLFSLVGMMIGTSGLRVVSILLCLFLIFILLTTFCSIIGNRVKIVSVVYEWTLIIIFSMLLVFSGWGSPSFGVDFQEIHFLIQNKADASFSKIILFLTTIIIGLYYLMYHTSSIVYHDRAFINRDSFPWKMI